MADEILDRDDNRITVLAGVTNDADKEIRMLRVDPITKRLLIKADISSALAGYVPYKGLDSANVDVNTMVAFNGSKQATSVTLGNTTSITLTYDNGTPALSANFTGVSDIKYSIRTAQIQRIGTDSTDLSNESTILIFEPTTTGLLVNNLIPINGTKDYQFLCIHNTSTTNELTIVSNSGVSDPSYDFDLPSDNDIVLDPLQSIWLFYNIEEGAIKWRVAQYVGAGGGGGLPPDGSYGDILVTGSGANWTVQNVASGNITGVIQPANHNYGLVYSQICGYGA